MAEYWRTKQFKALAKIWNQNLYDSGFVDAEIELKDDRVLKQKASNCYRNASELERESRRDYFLLLGYWAHNTEFPNDLERIIMIRHSEGATIKEIQKDIENIIGVVKFRKTIMYIIRRWQTKWGVKTWSLKEMNLRKRRDIES